MLFSFIVCFQINPPAVVGPVVHHLTSLDALNTSNERMRNFITGAYKEKVPASGPFLSVDVRDVALAHVLAAEKPGAANQRFFIVEGPHSFREIAEAVSEAFPEFKDRLPTSDILKEGEQNATNYTEFDNSKSKNVLGLTYLPFRDSVIDAVNSIRGLLEKQ